MAELLDGVMAALSDLSVTQGLVLGLILLLTVRYLRSVIFRNPKAPPHVPSPIPWLGNIVAFGEKPVDFLLDSRNKFGNVFSFTMFGTDVTYLLGSEASSLFWSSHNDKLNSEDLYKNITVPIFGKGVAFDVPNKVFSEQKQMCKEGLTKSRFAKYTGMVETETRSYIERMPNEGQTDLFKAMAEMIVFTATKCLHGHETRKAFDETVAGLYHDLDGGFSPLAWFFPPWMPFPSFYTRDAAHVELKKRFHAVIEERKASTVESHDDLLDTFIKSQYRNVNSQRKLNNDETSGLLIALLMAGQHTSSTTSTWFGYFMCKEEGLQAKLYAEQKKVMGDRGPESPITIEDLDQMPLLHSCVRETLRMRPPIMQMMRNVRETLVVKAKNAAGESVEYSIPPGNQVCVSPSVNGRNPEEWTDADDFKSDRFLDENGKVTEGNTDEMKHRWVPFGAGRHRCIGFEFAQLQIRCVWSTMLRTFELELPTGEVPKVNYRTMIHTPLTPEINFKRRVFLPPGACDDDADCSTGK